MFWIQKPVCGRAGHESVFSRALVCGAQSDQALFLTPPHPAPPLTPGPFHLPRLYTPHCAGTKAVQIHEQEREKKKHYLVFSSQAWGELGGQETWSSGAKGGDGRNVGRTEAARRLTGRFPGISWGRKGSPWVRVAVPPSGSCPWILEKKELRLWGRGRGEEWVYCQT